MTKATHVLAIAAALISASWPLCLNAAEVDDTGATSLQEIVVTAQKRSEDVNKVPISVSVFDKAALDRLNITDFSDLVKVSPGIDFAGGGANALLSIRGIYSNSGAATTGIYLDDTPVSVRVSSLIANGSVLPLVFDLDRVEVLRGPQGTLFGSGSEGGTIRFITPQPSLTEFSGYSRAGAGITDNGGPTYEIGVGAGGPLITDELGFRVSAWHRQDGGYIDYDSPLPGGYRSANGNWKDDDVLRAAMTFAPLSDLKITPSVYYQHIYVNNVETFDPGTPSNPDVFTSYFKSTNPQYSNVSNGLFINHNLLQTPDTDTFWLPALKVQFDFGGMELTSNSSYFTRTNLILEDFSNVTAGIYGAPWPLTPAAADHNWIVGANQVLSEDLRLQSTDPNSPLKWTVGLFYNIERQKQYNLEQSPYLPTLIQNTYGETMQQYYGLGLLSGDVSYLGTERDTDKQAAVYGQATYKILEHLNLTAGVRVAHESTNYNVIQNGPENGGQSVTQGTQSQTVTDPKFGIDVPINENNLLYLSAAKGDRIGGVNNSLSAVGSCLAALELLGLKGVPNSYGADSLWSYEIGSKNKLFNSHMQIQSSLFYTDWSNVQSSVYVPACANGFTANLGKATSYGGDLQMLASITDEFQVGLNIGYTNAKSADTVVVGTTQFNTKGNQLNSLAAPWQIMPTAQYYFPLANGHKAYIRVDDEYHSRNPGPFNELTTANASYNPNFIPNPAINELNTHVGTLWDGWDLSVYALNIQNNHPVLQNASQQQVSSHGGAFTIQPLTIGFTAILRW